MLAVDDIAYRLSMAIKHDVFNTRVYQMNGAWCVEVHDMSRHLGRLALYEKDGQLKVKMECSKQKVMFKRWAAIARRLVGDSK